MGTPREQLKEIGDERIAEAIKPLSWTIIKARIEHMDFCAIRNVSADGTLVASLVLRLVQAAHSAKEKTNEI